MFRCERNGPKKVENNCCNEEGIFCKAILQEIFSLQSKKAELGEG
jgi:hypothetical protein